MHRKRISISLMVLLALREKCIYHVVGTTYQHIDWWLLAEMLGDLKIFIRNQENINPKNTVEKINFDSVPGIMASSQ
ncbi:hypothetical protein AB205_0177690 [Aquarana catesbeiana]|uniref:Uncharacterized protein n=1 Tax=Aquarana catesbeiana TaxID=8400 RepID=A0A2G9REF6_AQUCT|nr:hypothetical protein AB205_0177690 [Aquarana catesbeiana]